jgi:dTDP-4-amino-4,6-dideoxygalactose transaminase
VKLRRLDEWNAQRRAAAVRYTQDLSLMRGITVPFEPQHSKAVYHLYVIRHMNRHALAEHLKSQDIATGLHYPLPLHLQKCYREWGYAAGSILSLPMVPGLTVDQQHRITEAVKQFVAVPEARAV